MPIEACPSLSETTLVCTPASDVAPKAAMNHFM